MNKDLHKECREKALKTRDRHFKVVDGLTKGKCICTDEWLASHDEETKKQVIEDVLKIVDDSNFCERSCKHSIRKKVEALR